MNKFVEPTERHMWEYWKDKRGIKEALQYDCPVTLQGNETLRLALVQIQSAEALIDNIMKGNR
jgi:hypothetical protein